MKQTDLENLIRRLPQSVIPFRYVRDRYALMLLAMKLSRPRSVRAIKSSPLNPLLSRPLIKQTLSRMPDGVLTDWQLRNIERELIGNAPRYWLTFAKWGSDEKDSWYQTSRPGWNLVIQLNFPRKHDLAYRRLLDPGDNTPFETYDHPISRPLNTLAWARIDIDDRGREALIEEVQTDWVREAKEMRTEMIEAWENDDSPDSVIDERMSDSKSSPRAVMHYLDDILPRYARVWDEAMLCAAIWFLRETINVRCIWYHSYASGNLLKKFNEDFAPPRSLYEQLPRRFCFERTQTPPAMIMNSIDDNMREKANRTRPSWFVIRL